MKISKIWVRAPIYSSNQALWFDKLLSWILHGRSLYIVKAGKKLRVGMAGKSYDTFSQQNTSLPAKLKLLS